MKLYTLRYTCWVWPSSCLCGVDELEGPKPKAAKLGDQALRFACQWLNQEQH